MSEAHSHNNTSTGVNSSKPLAVRYGAAPASLDFEQFYPLKVKVRQDENEAEIDTDSELSERNKRVAYEEWRALVVEVLGEDEEVNPAAPVLVGSAFNKTFNMVKGDASGWQPNFYEQHINPITCLEVHFGKNLLVTAEDSGKSSKVVIWDLTTFTVVLTISDSHGVKSMDISEDGELLLVVSADSISIVTLYRISTGAVLYGPIDMKDYVYAVRFTGQAYTFALCSQLRCVSFFVEDEEEECDDDLKFYNLEKGICVINH